MKKGLYEKLIEYGKDGNYPLHMPGHKRQCSFLNGADPFSVDITEITGFDDLHHAEGIIKEAMENAARYFGSDETWFLVNGSSCGILSAISGVTENGDSIIIGRNCHKSVYNAVQLRNLEVTYLYPEYVTEYGIQGGYSPKKIEQLFKEAVENKKQIKAVVLTSPTYEGMVSDIKTIAEIVHKYQAVLIVDEAHGAHFGISEAFPVPAYKLGADLVIESVHKTLPALTQSGLLHMCGGRVDRERIEEYLSIYQSSSPSYLLMASIDRCVRLMEQTGKKKAEQLLAAVEKIREKVEPLEYLQIPGVELKGKAEIYDVDLTKLVIGIKNKRITGKELSHILRNRYRFEVEMVAAEYVLAMTTVCDDWGELERLAQVLVELDENLSRQRGIQKRDRNIPEQNITGKKENISFCLPKNQVKYSVCDAKQQRSEDVILENAVGRVSAKYLYLYPPEIPLLVPGEIIADKLLEQIEIFRKQGLNLKGLEDNRISVLKE